MNMEIKIHKLVGFLLLASFAGMFITSFFLPESPPRPRTAADMVFFFIWIGTTVYAGLELLFRD
jgi:hypothetical protein